MLPLMAKTQNVEKFLKSGVVDASELTKNYINPVAQGLMYGLNNGWYTTARTHKKFGFDITFVANMSIVPTADRTFKFVQSNYKNLTLESGSNIIQTAMGDDNNTVLAYNYSGEKGKFDIPNGIGSSTPLHAIPSIVLQVGLGIPKIDADLKLRYLPKVGNNDVKVSILGIGLQKDLSKLLKIKYTPLHISVLVAFTNLKVDYDVQGNSKIDGENQELKYMINAFTMQVIGGVNFKLIEFYTSVGYNKAKTNVDLLGSYKLSSTTMSNPITLNFKNRGMRATVGTRLNLGFFKIFGDYTVQKYNTISGGIALSLR